MNSATTPAKERHKAMLTRFMCEVWSNGEVERCDTYLADTYTIHHDPGDPWDGQALDIEGFKTRVRLSRAPFPDQQFHVREMIADENAFVPQGNRSRCLARRSITLTARTR